MLGGSMAQKGKRRKSSIGSIAVFVGEGITADGTVSREEAE